MLSEVISNKGALCAMPENARSFLATVPIFAKVLGRKFTIAM